MNFETLLGHFRLTAVIPYPKACELVRYRAVCFVPHVAVSSTAGPEDALVTVVIQQLHIQNTWVGSVGDGGAVSVRRQRNYAFSDYFQLLSGK